MLAIFGLILSAVLEYCLTKFIMFSRSLLGLINAMQLLLQPGALMPSITLLPLHVCLLLFQAGSLPAEVLWRPYLQQRYFDFRIKIAYWTSINQERASRALDAELAEADAQLNKLNQKMVS